jgi:hypothetical protein
VKSNGADRSPIELADHFCRSARRRIAGRFQDARSNDDRLGVKVSRAILEERYAWLEDGIMRSCPEGETISGNGEGPLGEAAPPERPEPVGSS